MDVALAKDHEEAAALLRSHNALEGKRLKERMRKAWWDAGNVVVDNIKIKTVDKHHGVTMSG